MHTLLITVLLGSETHSDFVYWSSVLGWMSFIRQCVLLMRTLCTLCLGWGSQKLDLRWKRDLFSAFASNFLDSTVVSIQLIKLWIKLLKKKSVFKGPTWESGTVVEGHQNKFTKRSTWYWTVMSSAYWCSPSLSSDTLGILINHPFFKVCSLTFIFFMCLRFLYSFTLLITKIFCVFWSNSNMKTHVAWLQA